MAGDSAGAREHEGQAGDAGDAEHGGAPAADAAAEAAAHDAGPASGDAAAHSGTRADAGQGPAHAHEHAHDHGDHGHAHDRGHGDHGHEHAHGHGGHGHGHGHGHQEVRGPARLGQPRRHVDVGDGVFLAVVDEGEGPPVLFLHGFPTSAALWRNVIEKLAPAYRCIAPDLLGFGETTCPIDADYGVEAQAATIVRLLDALELGPVSVVGHDIGGGIAQVLAARWPERVERLVLIDAVAFDHAPPPVAKRLARLAAASPLFDLACETGALAAFTRSRYGMPAGAGSRGRLEDAFVEECLAPLYRETPPAYRAPRERFRRALMQMVREGADGWRAASEALADFTKPTLVIWGCDDPYVSVSDAKRLADTIPGCASLELLPYVGHWVPEEAPGEVAVLLGEHLAAPVEVGAGAAG